MATVRDLLGWLERDLSRFSPLGDHTIIDQIKDEVVVHLFTDTNHYIIRAREELLSCESKSRKPRAGETFHRGNLLFEGGLFEETWHKVLGHIVSYEMVRVFKKAVPMEKSNAA